MIYYVDCLKTLGVSTGRLVLDEDMTASSQLDPEHAPSGARLNYQNQFDSQGRITQIGGWSASTNDEHQWLQIKFSQIYQISGVASQGSSDDTQWVTTYKLDYSTDGATWIDYPQVRGLIPSNISSAHKLGAYAITTATATKTSLKEWICAASSLIVLIPSRLIRQMLATFFEVEF